MVSKPTIFDFPCSCVNCYLVEVAFHELKHTFSCSSAILRKWKALFKKFCVEEDSEIFDQICSQFKDYKAQEQFQIILLHQFKQGYLISEEYFFLYADLLIKDRIPISANVFGEELFLRDDERCESYLHPTDVFSVHIPKFWRKLFYNELTMYSHSYITNTYIQPQMIKTLSTTTRVMHNGPEHFMVGLRCLESPDLRPP